MQLTGGSGWRITMDTCQPMLVALYLRDAAGLEGAGQPALPHVAPAVRASDHSLLVSSVGGNAALRYQWELWWEGLLSGYPTASALTAPDFPELAALPALQRVAHAHHGAALDWAQERAQRYARLTAQRQSLGGHRIVTELVQNRELELGRNARDFTLNIVEVPLTQQRAWFIEPDKIIMGSHLLDAPDVFCSYVQPVVEQLV